MAGKAQIKAGKAFVVIEALDKTGRVLNRVASRFSAFGDRLLGMGAKLGAATAAALIPVGLATATFAGFDDTMRKVEARSRGTAAEMKALREQAKELGRTTSFTAVQVGELQSILARLGFTRVQIKDQTPAILNLARAAGSGVDALTDIQLATKLAAGTINAWGLQANETAHIADVYTAAVNNSALSLESLVDSMQYVGPVAAAMGLSVEDAVQTLGELSNVWIEGSRAGTSFRRILLNLATEVEKLTGMRIEVETEAGGVRALPDIINQLNKATAGMSQIKKMAVYEEIFGMRAIAAAAGLSRQTEQTKYLREAIRNAGGEATRVAGEMDAGIGGMLRRLASAWEGLKISIGEVIDEHRTLFDLPVKALGAITGWVETHRDLIATVLMGIASVAAFAGGLIALGLAVKVVGIAFAVAAGIVGIFTTAIGAAVTAIILLKTILLAALLSPLVIIIALIAAIPILLAIVSKSFRDTLKGIGKRIGEMGGTFVKTFKGIIAAMKAGKLEAAWDIALQGMKVLWLQFKDFVLDGWRKLVTSVTDLFLNVVWKRIAPLLRRIGIAVPTAGVIGGAMKAALAQADQERAAEIKTEIAKLDELIKALDRNTKMVAEEKKEFISPGEMLGLGFPPPKAAPSSHALDALRGLEKGTMEAATKAYQNQYRSESYWKKIIDVNKAQLAEEKRQADALEDAPVLKKA